MATGDRWRESLYGVRVWNPLKLMTFFVSEILISDARVIVFITILMIHMLPLNVAQQAFNDTHFCVVIRSKTAHGMCSNECPSS